MSPQEIGKAFAELDSPNQAEALIAAAIEARSWSGLWGMQFIDAGKELRARNDPGADAARDVVLYLLMGIFPKAESFRDGECKFLSEEKK